LSPKYRLLLAVLLTLLAICSQVVFGQTKKVQKIVHLSAQSLTVKIDKVQPKDCSTGPGSIAVTTSGGNGPYTFLWKGPSGYTAAVEDISNLEAGNYTYTITDLGGCSASNTLTVGSTCTGCNLFNSVNINNASACNLSDGSINVTITGGSGSYTYKWYNKNFTLIASTKNLTGAAPGTYYLEVTDNGSAACQAFYYFYVQSPYKVTTTSTGNTRCATPFTGSATANVTGGSGNYSYQWTRPDGSKIIGGASLTAIRGGNYSVVVKDNVTGCEVDQSIFVNTSPATPLSISESITASTSCVPANGAANITVSNGTGNYAYTWYNQTTGLVASSIEDLSAFPAAPYSVYVSDNQSGCVASKLITIPDQSVAPTYTVTKTDNTSCSAPYTGAVDLKVSTPGNYSFEWRNLSSVVSTNEDLSAIASGPYGLTIINTQTGCKTKVDATSPQAIQINDLSAETVQVSIDAAKARTRCNVLDGSIQTSIQSALPYATSWTGPNGFTSNLEDLTGLDSGVYILTVSVACNKAPVIEDPNLNAARSSAVELDLLEIISDPNDNLNPASVAITQMPESGAIATLSTDLVLTLQYNANFQGTDQMRIRACDFMNACTENTLTIAVDVEGGVVVYNAVAPNSPGDNKFMRIEHLPEVNRVSIFNRWGDKVFEVDGYENGVPGKRFEGFSSVGKVLPTGTYFYKIETSDSPNALTGYLSLKQ